MTQLLAVPIERLASHARLEGVPTHELEWLATHGVLRSMPHGTYLARVGDPRDRLYFGILLAGSIITYVQRDGVQRRIRETRAGDLIGILPFSRMTYATADIVVGEPVEILQLDPALLPEMIRECPAVTAASVHSMIDRSSVFTESSLHDEKMFSLGKLASGLAHELNNPASAALRSAQALMATQETMESAADAVAQAELTPRQRAIIRELAKAANDGHAPNDGPISRAEREDAIVEWLTAHGVDSSCAPLFADAGLGADDLRVLDELPRDAIAPSVTWIGARVGARGLASEIDRATRRIHDLVAAVRGFTQMDRPLGVEDLAIAPGIRDTVKVLESKAAGRSVAVRVDLPANLPPVRASATELNQVWANLVENAIDAAPHGGIVTVSAAEENDVLLVRVIDGGAGIPDEIRGRIFDPVFTTKPVGQGRGLGLDIARRLVRLIGGQIDVESRPGHTEFQISLPIVRRPLAS